MSRVGTTRTFAAAALLAASAPATAAAQGAATLDLFTERKQSTDSALFGGGALTLYKGMFGLRLGGAVSVGDNGSSTSSPLASPLAGQQLSADYWHGHGGHGPGHGPGCVEGCMTSGRQSYQDLSMIPGVDNWSAEADLLVEPLRVLPVVRSLLLGFSPYAFAGIGRWATNQQSTAATNIATWSFGAGVQHQLLGRLGVKAEARYRQPLESRVTSLGDVPNESWNYRAGVSITLGGGKRKRSAPASAPVSAEPTVATAPPTPATADDRGARVISRVLDEADGLVDRPYAANGDSPSRGFDAPGFVQYVFEQEGVSLPRTIRELAAVGTEVPTRVGSLRPGDLLLFSNDGTRADHVAIYVGHERIIHSSASGDGVRYDDLGEGTRGRWFAEHLVAARRVIDVEGTSTRAEPAAGGDRAPRATRRP